MIYEIIIRKTNVLISSLSRNIMVDIFYNRLKCGKSSSSLNKMMNIAAKLNTILDLGNAFVQFFKNNNQLHQTKHV